MRSRSPDRCVPVGARARSTHRSSGSRSASQNLGHTESAHLPRTRPTCHQTTDAAAGSSSLSRFRARWHRVASSSERRGILVTCPHCESTATTRRICRTALGYRRFNCRSCRRRFNERTGPGFNDLQYPTDVVLLAVLCRCATSSASAKSRSCCCSVATRSRTRPFVAGRRGSHRCSGNGCARNDAGQAHRSWSWGGNIHPRDPD